MRTKENYYVNLFSRIPYSHFVELIKIKEDTKRKFYELLIIKNTLSVRELERQIATLTYERVGLSNLSQLNSYVGYYKDQIKQTDDNAPIGILLCTEKGKKMVEYALAGMEEKLFVSKYLLELPSKELLSKFIENELKNL